METNPTDVRHPEEEGKLSGQDKDSTSAELDWVLSKGQTYQKTGRTIKSYLGCRYISDFDACSSSADDNPFTRPKHQSTGKISVN